MAQTMTQDRQANISAVDAARCLIKIANDERQNLLAKAGNDPYGEEIKKGAITPLKLQKVLFFAQAASLVTRNKALFEDEFEAWQLGPAIRQVYKTFEKHKGNLIPAEEGSCENITPEIEIFLKKVWNTFGRYSSMELVEMTHSHAPWKDAFDPKKRDTVIAKEKILEFYKGAFAKQ